MNKEPIIFITKPEKQLKEKDNLEIEINNYDNSHLYYKGFDLGTFKEIANLRQQNKKYKKVIEKAIEYIESKEYQYGDEEQDNYIYDIGFDEVNELLDILKGMK